MDSGNGLMTAACTIVSKNYFAFARVLGNSYLEHNPGSRFFVLLVDKNNGDIDFSRERFEVIEASEIGIAKFIQTAFRFDVLELNTNVKPSFLSFLLEQREVDQLLYLDPDISVYRNLDPIFQRLNQADILLTPHTLAPVKEGNPRREVDLLVNGIFNLGFIGVRKSESTAKFLEWWENRCLNQGFNEATTGLFVDQKWINLVPCFFDNVEIFKHPGCNVAYWNLHERSLYEQDGTWLVNTGEPLLFYHFSGFELEGPDCISRYEDHFTLKTRPEMRKLFENYRDALIANDFRRTRTFPYAYNTFSGGESITSLARRLYAANEEEFLGADPFASDGPVFRWCLSEGLITGHPAPRVSNKVKFNRADFKVRAVNRGLKGLLRLLGPDRYILLMKYLGYISVLRNQRDFIKPRNLNNGLASADPK